MSFSNGFFSTLTPGKLMERGDPLSLETLGKQHLEAMDDLATTFLASGHHFLDKSIHVTKNTAILFKDCKFSNCHFHFHVDD